MKIGGDKCVKLGFQFDKSFFIEVWDGEYVVEEFLVFLGFYFIY